MAVTVKSILQEHGAIPATFGEHEVDALTGAVASYLESEGGEAGVFIGSGQLVMLASRVLRSLGAGPSAHRLTIFGTGLVKPSAWTLSGGGSAWRVDMQRLLTQSDAALEMVLFACVQAILDCLAEAWDSTNGHGSLVLRGLDQVAADLLQRREQTRPVRQLVDEVRAHCEARLRQMQTQRSWQFVPALMRDGMS